MPGNLFQVQTLEIHPGLTNLEALGMGARTLFWQAHQVVVRSLPTIGRVEYMAVLPTQTLNKALSSNWADPCPPLSIGVSHSWLNTQFHCHLLQKVSWPPHHTGTKRTPPLSVHMPVATATINLSQYQNYLPATPPTKMLKQKLASDQVVFLCLIN